MQTNNYPGARKPQDGNQEGDTHRRYIRNKRETVKWLHSNLVKELSVLSMCTVHRDVPEPCWQRGCYILFHNTTKSMGKRGRGQGDEQRCWEFIFDCLQPNNRTSGGGRSVSVTTTGTFYSVTLSSSWRCFAPSPFAPHVHPHMRHDVTRLPQMWPCFHICQKHWHT